MPDPVRSKADVLARLRTCSTDVRALGVRRLGLFGSFGRDRAERESDVDVLVEFEPGAKTFDRFMALADLLEDVLGRPVELVTTDALSPYIGPHVLEEVEDVPLAA